MKEQRQLSRQGIIVLSTNGSGTIRHPDAEKFWTQYILFNVKSKCVIGLSVRYKKIKFLEEKYSR